MTTTSTEPFSSQNLPKQFGNFELLCTEQFESTDIILSKYRSKETGLTVVHLDYEAPLVNGCFVVATEIFNDSGCPHTLEHLILNGGSEKYPYGGILEHLASRGFADVLNAITYTDRTTYMVSTAGEQSFLQILPIYIHNILYPTITEEGFISEVHHIDTEGKDSGVVYSELQGCENDCFEIMSHKMGRLLNPQDSAYRSRTGGLMETLRSLNLEQIRDYHKDYYVPHNLSLIITGKMSEGTPSILSILQEQVEPSIIAHKQNHGPKPAGWKRPFLETPSADRKPILHSCQEVVTFPTDDESLGQLLISYRGPAPSEFLERKALEILSSYLTSSSVAPLNKEYVEVEPSLCAYIFLYEVVEATSCTLRVYADGIPVEHLTSFSDRLRSSLARIAEEGLDMERMAMVINRDERQRRRNIESLKGFTFETAVISDFLYGKEDGSELRQVLNEMDNYEVLKKWSKKQWKLLLKKYYVDPHSVVVCAKPEKPKEDKEARIAARARDTRPDDLQNAAKRLEEAEAINKEPIPEEIIRAFPIPDVKTLSWIPIDSVHGDSVHGSGGVVANSKLREHLHGDGDPLPFFVGFDHFQSHFVTVSAYVSMSAIPNHLRPYISIYASSFFSLPVELPTGELLSYEQVVDQLRHETVMYEAELGVDTASGVFLSVCSGNAFMEFLRVSIQVEKDRYGTAVQWLKNLFHGNQFDEGRLSATLAEKQKTLPMMRDGWTVLRALTFEYLYGETSTPRAGTILKQEKFVADLIQQLQDEPEKVNEGFETIMGIVKRPEGIRFSVAGNVLSIKDPKKPWRGYFCDPGQTPLQPVPFSNATLGGLGKKPANKAFVVSLPATKSSYASHVSSGVQGFDHEDLPALLITLGVLMAPQGYLWRSVRTPGFCYGFDIWNDTEAGILTFSLYQSSNYIAAYDGAARVVQGLVDETIPLEDTAIDAAKSGVAFRIAKSVSTPGKAASVSFLNHLRGVPPDYNIRLLEKCQAVNKEQVMWCLRAYILKLFKLESSVAFVVTAPDNLDEIAGGLEKKGFQVKKREIEVQDDGNSTDGSTSDLEV